MFWWEKPEPHALPPLDGWGWRYGDAHNPALTELEHTVDDLAISVSRLQERVTELEKKQTFWGWVRGLRG